MKFIYITIKKQ